MSAIRNFLAVSACKALIKIGKLMGRKGSSAPGSIAMKIAPGLLKHLAKQVKKEIILVCGTNGKTTTNNLIYSLFTEKGNKVVCNNVGANMLPGVACSFIAMATLTGKLDADYAAIECDEASLRHVVNHITPHKIVITNLFRDQMDRYGEVEDTAKLLEEGIKKVPDATLVLNADDPYVRSLGLHRRAIYYGVSEDTGLNKNEAHESQFCLKCGKDLTYSYHHYNQLGFYECTNCDFKRPNPNYSATRVNVSEGLKFVMSYKGIQRKFNVNYKGFYNVYNILASYAVFEDNGGTAEEAEKTFNAYKPQIGRMESFTIGGKEVILNLAKNPAGFNQAISTVCADKREKTVLVAVNAMASDGTDVSWLWDVDFEALKENGAEDIYVSGIRRDDLALRLKYAGFENINIIEINADTVKNIIDNSQGVCYMLVNYTVLFGTQTILKGLEG